MNPPRKDPYAILGIACDASDKAVKKRYRRLCKRFHPDLNQGDVQATEIFREIKWAYETIATMRAQKAPNCGGSLSDSEGITSSDGKHPFFSFFHAIRAHFMNSNRNKEA